jgi:diguanylate cyclase (GGDEF)-like protein
LVDSELTMQRRWRWSLLLVLAVAVLGLLAARELTQWIAVGRAIGVEFQVEDEALVVDYVRPGGPAEGGGLRVGDRLLEIAGCPVARLIDYDLAARDFARGRPVPFRVYREGGTLTLEIRPGIPYPWFRSAVNALSCLAFLALALLTLSQETVDPRGRLLGAFSSAVAVELAMPLNLIGFPGYDEFAFPLLSLLIGLEIGLELHLAALIPRAQPWLQHRRWAVPTMYAAGIGLGVFHAATQLDQAGGTGWLPWSMDFADLLFWDVGTATWAVLLVILLARPTLSWPDPVGRHQAGLVLTGVLPWAVLVFVRIVHEQVLGTTAAWIGLTETLALLIYPLAIFIAIFRYQLFDLEMVVKRGILFTSLASSLVLLFYLVVASSGFALSRWFSPSRWMLAAVAVAGLVMGLAFSPLRRALQRLVERQVFPERRALRERLIQLARELPSHGTLAPMGKELVDQLSEIFEVDWAAVLLSEGESGLLVLLEATGLEAGSSDHLLLSPSDPAIEMLRESQRPIEADRLTGRSDGVAQRLKDFGVQLVVPLVQKEQLVGLLLLGSKTRGGTFLAEEKELLSLLSHHVATVFENAHLFESATHDSLTGLLRREAILDHLERELRRAKRFDRPLTIAMADLDYFKEVNDAYGHLTGDVALKQVAKALSTTLRESDEVGRYGGEEFLIMLTETDLAGARTVAEKIRRAVQNVQVAVTGGGVARVTLSIGLADRNALTEGESSAIHLIDLADRTLYVAKSQGRNRVGVYGEE